MKKKKKDNLEQYKDIVVADMNVEGMPWHSGRGRGISKTEQVFEQKEELTAKETRGIIAGAMAAALLAGAIMIGIFFLLIWFCVNVWLV